MILEAMKALEALRAQVEDLTHGHRASGTGPRQLPGSTEVGP